MRRELRSSGRPVPLGGRAFEIVEALVGSAGELVTKDDLMHRIWPGAIVEEGTLHVHMSAIRKALGPDRSLIKTVSGRGYRLEGNWTPRPQVAGAPVAAELMQALKDHPATNFSGMATHLVGRSEATQRVRDLLSAWRVVTLTGPGGIGKTALAIKAARGLLTDFEGGGWLVELASLSDPERVPPAVANVLGLQPGGDKISAEDVARTIGGAHLLLMLDNCEHVIEAVARLAESLVRLCPRVTILATSRETLRIEGETVYRVPPLDVPTPGRDEAGHILGHSAVELFVARIKALDSGFSPRADELPNVGAICRRLDGIPLAIEFAAAHAATVGIQQVAAGLHDRFALLTRGRRTAVPRHRTLRGVLDWSYELLSEAERFLLRHLAVFSGGFTIDAAAAVANDEVIDRSSVMEGIANLIAKSLVALDRDTASRWYLLETIRAYALEKLCGHGERDRAAQRHAMYFRDLLSRSASVSDASSSAVERTDRVREIDNVRAALSWCFSPGGTYALGVELTVAAVPIWMQMSLVLECRTGVQRALAVSPVGASDAASLRMKLLGALAGTLLGGVAENLDVNQVWATVFDVAEEVGSIDYQLRALLGMCRDHYKNSKLDEALALSEKFCAIAEGSTDPVDRLIGERMMGYTLHFRGEQAKARQHIENMLHGYDEVVHGSHVMRYWFDRRVTALTRLAQILWLQGFPDRAADIVDRSLRDALADGHGPSLCSMLAQGPCPIAIANGDLEKADDAVRLLLELSAKHELRGWAIWGHGFDSLVMIRRGAIAEGCQKLRIQVERVGQADTPLPFTGFIAELALAHAKLGEYREAVDLIDTTLDRCARDHELWIYPELLRSKGEIVLAQGGAAAAATAEQLFAQALVCAERQEVLSWGLRAATSLGHLRRSQGRLEDAREPLASLYSRFTEGFETADLRTAKALLDSLAG
jgi:predicted ATPase/DNA-binding winged helix-turn-helix (wHTH) protein